MLRIVESTSAAAAKSYYTESLTRGDYYLEQGEIVGRWGGRGAERLGLVGTVDRKGFEHLAENLTPEGLPLTARTKDHRRVGYDLNFHAPKSLSILYGHTGDERLLEAFRQAVDSTMKAMETEMKARVRVGGEHADRITGNLVWAEFVHTTARPVHGVADPHLHAHCFTFNATYDRDEARWKAGQFGDLKRDARYFEAVFHSRLAGSVAELGYGIERTAKGWEVAGIDRDLREKFSQRTNQIERLAQERGLTGEAKAQLGALTREAKTPGVTWGELLSSWQARMTFDEWRAVEHVVHEQPPPRARSLSPDEALGYAVEHSFERASAVPEREISGRALRLTVGTSSVEEIQSAIERSDLIRREIDGRALVTSPKVLDEEREMLAFARGGRGQEPPLGRAEPMLDPALSAEQRAAVEHVLTSNDRVIAIRGGAGTGKTTLMREAVREIRAGGHEVYLFAPTAEASRGVLRAEGFQDADTVAHFLKDPMLQEELRGKVVWIDEAGLLGTRSLAQAFRIAQEKDLRLILSGDSHQHAAVERGDALRLLEARAGVRAAELTEIRRQRGDYKEAVATIARGDLDGGFERLERLGAVREVADADARYRAVARDFVAAREERKSVLVISPTHAEADRVTRAVREALQEAGHLGNRERYIRTLSNLQWTEAERRDPARYEPGQNIVFHQNARGFRRGERFEIAGHGPRGELLIRAPNGTPRRLPLGTAPRFQVFAVHELALAKGEVVRATQNATTADGHHRLVNGALYEVQGFDLTGRPVLSNGWTLPRDACPIAHGYCSTSHASQGKTVDRVLLAQSAESARAASQEQFYVSVSRRRESVHIFTDDRQALRHAITHSDRRISATELAEHAPTLPTQQFTRFLHQWRQLLERVKLPTLTKGIDLER